MKPPVKPDGQSILFYYSIHIVMYFGTLEILRSHTSKGRMKLPLTPFGTDSGYGMGRK